MRRAVCSWAIRVELAWPRSQPVESEVPAPADAPILGGRSTVGHRALDAVIGVRIPASQPASAHASRELRLGRLLSPSAKEHSTREGCLAGAGFRRATAIAGRYSLRGAMT